MAVAFRAVTTAQGSDATAEGTTPAGSADGDLMIAFLDAISATATITGVPTGWALQEADPNPADFSLWCYTKLWASGEPNPTWTISAAGDWDLTIVSYSGVDTTTPVNVDIGEQIAVANSIDLGPITPTVNDCMLVAYANVDASTAGAGRTYTTTGMTQRVNESTFLTPHHRVLADKLLTGGSGVGQSQTCTVSGTAQDIGGFLLALAPAAGVTPVGKDLALQWDTRSALGDTIQALWDVRQAVGDPVALQWDARALATKSVQAVWDVRSAVGDPIQLTWDLRSVIADESVLRWDVRTATGDTVQAVWDVRAAVGDTVQLVWDVASSLVVVTPTERTLTIPLETRVNTVASESRTFTVPPEIRTMEV